MTLTFYALRQKVPYWLKQRVGGAQPNINQQIIRDTKIPLPPLDEQRRIAAILDKADAIRRKRKQAIALTEELLRATFLDMFGDPVTNPKGWEVVQLQKVIENIEAGWSANGEERKCLNGEWGVLKISAVTSGWFAPSEHKAVGGDVEFKKKPILPRKGDLLFSRANTRELVAATCLVEKDCSNLFLPDKLWRITPFSCLARSEYLRFLLSDSAFRQLITRQATGTSGSMLNVSQAKLLGVSAPIPPVEKQDIFRDITWKAFKLREIQQSTLINSHDAFSSLLQRAFRGDL
jgi:type I restriction enzyme, S subunit